MTSKERLCLCSSLFISTFGEEKLCYADHFLQQLQENTTNAMSCPSLHSMVWKTKPIVINKASSSNLLLHSSSSSSDSIYQQPQQHVTTANVAGSLPVNSSASQMSPINSPNKAYARTPTELSLFDFKRRSRSASFTIGDDEHA